MASTLTVQTISNGAVSTSSANVIQGSAKAWANFGYVSSAMVTRGSFNVSSITRAGTGDYTVNFTNALASANYAPTLGINPTGSQIATAFIYVKSRAAGSVQLQSWYGSGGAAQDVQEVDFAIFI